MININKIEALLERYYDAQTTVAEERLLWEFFAGDNVPPHLQTERRLFLQLQNYGTEGLPEGLRERLEQTIDSLSREERPVVKKRGRAVYIRRWVSVAAALLLLLIIGHNIYDNEPADFSKDTCVTPEEAYREAHRALAMFSVAIDKSLQQMEDVGRSTKELEANIQKQINKLN